MKTLLTLLILLSFYSFAQKTEEEILSDREQHEVELTDTTNGLLNSDELTEWKGLDYFDVDSNYRVVSTFKKKKGKWFEMATSTDRKPIYRVFGTITFTIDSVEHQLTIYQNKELKKKKEYKDYLFIPFRDKTSSVTTYGGGRYLDIVKPKSSEVEIDFNLAYNPYCAYTYRFSCPIPPKENTLDIKIEAGEKIPLGNH